MYTNLDGLLSEDKYRIWVTVIGLHVTSLLEFVSYSIRSSVWLESLRFKINILIMIREAAKCVLNFVFVSLFFVSHTQIHPLLLHGNRTDTCKSRQLRRTISVPVETQSPEFQCHLSVDNSECTAINLHAYDTVKKKKKLSI